ncbi:MAG: hypothetical protein DYG92_08825 [Leptolyngbya sp. PLA1]|nr:hypothetical protein [Leptolyngbya sp. PLA1]
MIQHRDNWPTGSKFAARLASVERFILRQQVAAARLNSRLLDLLEASIGFDVWDGTLAPDDAESRFRREFDRAAERCGLRADPSIPKRIERLREQARRTFTPPE